MLKKTLPREIYWEIFKFLDLSTLKSILLSNKFFYNIIGTFLNKYLTVALKPELEIIRKSIQDKSRKKLSKKDILVLKEEYEEYFVNIRTLSFGFSLLMFFTLFYFFRNKIISGLFISYVLFALFYVICNGLLEHKETQLKKEKILNNFAKKYLKTNLYMGLESKNSKKFIKYILKKVRDDSLAGSYYKGKLWRQLASLDCSILQIVDSAFEENNILHLFDNTKKKYGSSDTSNIDVKDCINLIKEKEKFNYKI